MKVAANGDMRLLDERVIGGPKITRDQRGAPASQEVDDEIEILLL
jgi:hypothetical protein